MTETTTKEEMKETIKERTIKAGSPNHTFR
jgi:hypothetical protein